MGMGENIGESVGQNTGSSGKATGQTTVFISTDIVTIAFEAA